MAGEMSALPRVPSAEVKAMGFPFQGRDGTGKSRLVRDADLETFCARVLEHGGGRIWDRSGGPSVSVVCFVSEEDQEELWETEVSLRSGAASGRDAAFARIDLRARDAAHCKEVGRLMAAWLRKGQTRYLQSSLVCVQILDERPPDGLSGESE